MAAPLFAPLSSRAVVRVGGADWRGFLQGLISQDVESLAAGELRFAALLSPQGRLLFDLFVAGVDDGCLLDCRAEGRDALVQRLGLYRLRAKVDLASLDLTVAALWAADGAPDGWRRDPRLAELGFRGYGTMSPADAEERTEEEYERFRLDLGVPGSDDFGQDRTYPIEADFDLLGGVDFKKGCYIGQETTSRMKRRGQIKSRMAPLAFAGPPPPPGSEVLAGELRAGQVLSGVEGAAMALLRLDRLAAGPLALADGRPCETRFPDWFEARRGT
jgi:folate-binding protein YgfZ